MEYYKIAIIVITAILVLYLIFFYETKKEAVSQSEEGQVLENNRVEGQKE